MKSVIAGWNISVPSIHSIHAVSLIRLLYGELCVLNRSGTDYVVFVVSFALIIHAQHNHAQPYSNPFARCATLSLSLAVWVNANVNVYVSVSVIAVRLYLCVFHSHSRSHILYTY